MNKFYLPDSCLVDQAANLKKQFEELLKKHKDTELDFSNVQEADLSLFQLLQSLLNSFTAHNLTLKFIPNLNTSLSSKANNTGWSRLLKQK